MYHSFKVSNFRCFQEFSISNLKRINLIAGVNNVGKTTLLEALFLHCGAYNPQLTMILNALRGIESITFEFGQIGETPWDSFFIEHDATKQIQLVGEDKETGRRELKLKIVRRHEDFNKITQFIQHNLNETEVNSLSSESPQVLELQYQDNRGKGSYYLIMDQKGIRGIPIPPSPPFPAIFLSSRVRIPMKVDAERFGKLEIKGQLNILTKALQVIEPRLNRLTVIVSGGDPIIHGDIGLNRLVPIPLMGEGMTRLTSLVLAIGNSQNGVIMVDEIENGLHHSILPKVWRVIGEVANQFNVQIFATTHSLECIIAAYNAFEKTDPYEFCLHRLERINENIRDVTYNKESLAAAIETGLEMR